MSSAIVRVIRCAIFLLLVSTAALATAKNNGQPVLSLSAQDVAALSGLTPGKASIIVKTAQKAGVAEWRFHAIRLQSGEQTLADDPEGHLAKRRFLISERGLQQIALAFEADGRFAFGFLDDQNGLQQLRVRTSGASGLHLVAEALEQSPVDCEVDGLEQPVFRPLKLPPMATPLIAKAGVPGHQAKVAIEVDFAMMSGHFSNSSANALNWLQQMFLATNLFYQRDLALQLVMALPVIYNTSTDPYCTVANPCPAMPSGAAELMFQFGDNWRNSHTGIDRDFATLISGRLSSGNPTGVSWTDQYCETGADITIGGIGTVTRGSYGVNLYVAGNGFSGGTAAELFGHELGHSLGAEHNNCTDSNPGAAGLQPIDTCRYGGGSTPSVACYSSVDGPTSCPSAGAGLMMSSGCSDVSVCGSGGLNRIREFHPAQISLLSDKFAENTPACLSTTTLPNPDTLFYDGFE